MSRKFWICNALFAALTIVGSYRAVVWACAIAPLDNEWAETQFEDALIVWDSKTKTEHFIRQANFTSTAREFGFLVPTPTQPTLAEVDATIFNSLEWTTRAESKPQVVKLPRPPQKPDSGEKTMAEPPVSLLDRTVVAGFDASVLKATDVDALAQWLTTNGYAFRPALRDWLKKYTDDGWIITAFKFAAQPNNRVNTKAIQMSFQADQPFYPYREPEDMRDNQRRHGDRRLRLFVLSDERVAGKLGDDRKMWEAPTVWANEVTRKTSNFDVAIDLIQMPNELKQRAWWLTEFDDRASPRRQGMDELYLTAMRNVTVARQVHYYQVIEYVDPPKEPLSFTQSDSIGQRVAIFGAAAALLLTLAFWLRRRWGTRTLFVK